MRNEQVTRRRHSDTWRPGRVRQSTRTQARINHVRTDNLFPHVPRNWSIVTHEQMSICHQKLRILILTILSICYRRTRISWNIPDQGTKRYCSFTHHGLSHHHNLQSMLITCNNLRSSVLVVRLFLSRVSILTRDIDIANLSVRLSVRYVPVLYENSLTYCHSLFTIQQPNHSSFTGIKHHHEIPTGSHPAGAPNTGAV